MSVQLVDYYLKIAKDALQYRGSVCKMGGDLENRPICVRCKLYVNVLKPFIKIKGDKKSWELRSEEDRYYHKECLEVVVYE